MGPDETPLPVPEGLPNTHMRLYGGAQYHRAMAEFRSAVGAIACPDISREEIVNACAPTRGPLACDPEALVLGQPVMQLLFKIS